MIFPLWCIVYEKKNFVIIISDTASQAEDFLREVKAELLGNALVKRDFPYACGKSDFWRQDEIVTKNNRRVLALGAQSKILGRRHGVNRPDLVLGDDLETEEDVTSALIRERMRNWFFKEVMKAGDVAGTTDFFVLGTIKHQDSLLSNLLDVNKNPGWQSRKFVAVKSFADDQELWAKWEDVYRDKDNPNRFDDAKKFFEERKDRMLEGAEVLWPEGEDYYTLMQVKMDGEVSFYSEKMNQPIDRSKCLIELEELRFYDDKDLEDRDLVVFGALDPATGKSRVGAGDYACIVTVGKCRKSGKVFVLDANFTKYGIEYQIKNVLKKHGRFNYHQFGVEENAFQVLIKTHLEKLSRLSQIHVPIVGIKHGGKEKKELRIEWAMSFLKDGTVYLHPSQKLLIEQLVNYIPMEGAGSIHDDGPDALAMALKMSLKKKFRMLFW